MTVYAAGANGNVARIQAISGSNTRLRQPFGIAVNAEGQIYVDERPKRTKERECVRGRRDWQC